MPLGFVGRIATKTAIGRAADELAERLADQTEAAIDTAVRLRAPSLAAGVEVERDDPATEGKLDADWW